jgi:hypothetical protein
MGTIRFAYGALSVAATLIALVTASGFNWNHPKMADLQPTAIYRNADRQVHLVYARSSKFVSDLRVVNEIQSRLRQDSEIPRNSDGSVPESSPQKQPGRNDGAQIPSPKQQNRANDITKPTETLAAWIPASIPGWMQTIGCGWSSTLLRRIP